MNAKLLFGTSSSNHIPVCIVGEGELIPYGPVHWRPGECAEFRAWLEGTNTDPDMRIRGLVFERNPGPDGEEIRVTDYQGTRYTLGQEAVEQAIVCINGLLLSAFKKDAEGS